MSKRNGMPNAFLIILFGAVASCTIAKARAGDSLNEASRPVLAQMTPATPQQGTSSGATQPSIIPPQSTVPGTAAPGAPSPAAQPTVPVSGQAGAPVAGQAAPSAGGQGVVPSQGISATSGAVREKETKETKETKEVKDRPSDWVELIGAVAWPVAITLIVMFIFLLFASNKTIQQLFGIAVSAVQQIEIAGVKLAIDTSVVDEVKQFLGGSLHKLVEKAKAQYERTASHASVEDRLEKVVEALEQILTQNKLSAKPNDLRATIHVPDIVFKDYMYQLVDYYPRSAHRSKTAGRRLSQRFGIVGRAWRLRQSMGRGKAISGSDAANELISLWGMKRVEAYDQSHLERPANLCVLLIDAQDNNNEVGLLYIDSTKADAFGVNTPQVAPAAAREAAFSAALKAAEAVAQAAAHAAALETADPTAHAAAEAVVLAANGVISKAAKDAAVQAINHDAAQAAALSAAKATAEAIADEANIAAQAATGTAAQASAAVARAASETVGKVVAATQAEASIVVLPVITAEQVAIALQNHEHTKALARAVNQAMAPLRGAGPALDITDLRYESENV